MVIRLLAAFVALVVAAPAWAQGAPFTFRSGERTYSIVPPEGYCTGTAAADRIMAFTKTGGGVVPSIVFARCDASADIRTVDFVAVKATGTLYVRENLMAELAATIDAARESDSLIPESTIGDMRARSRALLGADIELEAKVVPVGLDEICGYLAGHLEFALPGGNPVRVGLIGCIASVEGEVMYFFRYDSADVAGLADKLPGMKDMAVSVKRE